MGRPIGQNCIVRWPTGKKDAKAQFSQLIHGENRVSGNVWYYLLGFFIATFIISRIMKIDSSQSEEKPVQSGAALLVGAVALTVLFAVEYGFAFRNVEYYRMVAWRARQ